MAYVRQLPSGRWQGQVTHEGKRTTRTYKLKSQAKAWADDLESGLRSGKLGLEAGRRTTMNDWHERWSAARSVEPITARKDRSILDNHVLPKWGAWHVQSVKRLDVQAWVIAMTKAGVGAPTVSECYGLLSKMMSDAVLEGLIASSPCQKIKLPRKVKPAERWLTEEEYGRLQIALEGRTLGRRGGHVVPDPHRHVWQAYVALGCYSGLRPGELAGLDVAAVDFDRRLVTVGQVLTREGLRAYPKTDSSVRTVPFPESVGDLLWKVCADKSGGPVFTGAEGARVSEFAFRQRVWTPALKAAGVEYARPYVMRHTCASWLIQAGVPDYQVAKMLGHSSTRLLTTYAHLSPDQHDRIRGAWGASVPTDDLAALVSQVGPRP